MTVTEIIRKLRECNIALSIDNGSLRVRGNKQALQDSELLELIRQNRDQLIERIAGGENLDSTDGAVSVPPNLIPEGCAAITPEMLPLVMLSQVEIDRIVAAIPGGAQNVQDIYPLAPLQEGMLFHHVLETEGDVYLLSAVFSIETREHLNQYLATCQALVQRHDVMRTCVQWEGLSEPVQVVCRKAPLIVEEISLDPADGGIAEQMRARFDPRHYRLNLRQAPLWRLFIAEDLPNHRWLVLELMHHLITDNTSGQILLQEMEMCLLGREEELPPSVPFRNFVMQARLGTSRNDDKEFFTRMLGDVDEPTAPFGLIDVQRDGSKTIEAHRDLDPTLSHRLRNVSRLSGVTTASTCHLACAQVLGRLSGRQDVVFSTMMFGRMRGGEGADRALGLFNNSLPLRINVGGESALESVRKTQMMLIELMQHEHTPLALAQRCSAVQAPAPLFTAMMNYRYGDEKKQGATGGAESSKAWTGIKNLWREGRINYPVGVAVNDEGEDFSIDCQADASIDSEMICTLMITALDSLVTALEKAPATLMRDLQILPASERTHLLALGNGGPGLGSTAKTQGCLYDLVTAQAEQRPDSIAVVEPGRELTYRRLFQMANGVGQRLKALGAGPEDRVAILADRSIESLVGMLGILAAGAAYLPLDPNSTTERLGLVLEDASVFALLAPATLREQANLLTAQHPVLKERVLIIADAPACDVPPASNVNERNAAYIIYTSGSTGKPKGVVIEHHSVMNLAHAFAGCHDFADQRLLMIPPLLFDASVGDVFPVLLVGATLILHPEPAGLGAVELQEYCEKYDVTEIDAPAALWRRWTEGFAASSEFGKVLPRVKLLMFGGESVQLDMIHRFNQLTENRITLTNHYGPTEATVCATVLTTRSGDEWDGSELPIGRPLPGVQLYVLDQNQQLLPRGVEGELYIGGVGVARGYLGDSELTAERFLRDPFSSDAGARMYRTGDLGCWLADGNIQYQGRNDFQVKIRGFRIELGEIEAKLASYPAVREAVVIAREDTPGDKRLVAYVTAASQTDGTAALIDAEQLRSHLSAVLPEYMIPAAYVRLESLPLTPNGKLDRKALPAPEADAYATRNYEPPQGEIETKLAAIWAEVLKLDKVGRHDNFFALGGHSLLAVRVVTRLQQALGVEVAIRDLFAYPELAGLASFIESAAPSVLPLIVPAKRSERLPLSFAQQRLWFLAQMEGVSEAYHIPVGLRLKGDLNRVALSMALDRILARHEALRTTFAFVDGDPLQRIAAAGASRYQLVEHDLRLHGDAQAELHRLTELEANTPFDLEYGPLIRGRLIRLSEDEHVLLITMHHIVSDGWSMGVLVNELSTLYGAFLRGEDDPLPKLEIQYADYAVWQRQWIEGEILQRQAVYWKTALAGAPEVLELPADHPRPAEQNFAGAFSELRLDEQLTASLKDLSKRHGTTLYITLLAAWSALLARLSGQQDVVIGSPAANRGRAEIENLIGFFVNTLVLRMDLSGSPTVSALLKQAKAQALAAQHHQDIPFEQVVELANPVRSLAHSPLFQVMFAWENLEIGSPELPGLEVRELEAVSYRVAKFDLTLALQEADNTIVGGIEYATSLFEQATIERYLGYFRNLLQAMVADDTQIVDRLPILGEAERHRLLYEWNETYRNYPRGQCIHQLFEEQAAKTPDAVAVVFEDKFLSYAELNRQANQLAHYLIRLGVKPDQRVALCVQRSPEMIVGMLAILKAGGAYVPLDPVYPVERLTYMLEDCAPVAVLVQAGVTQLDTGTIPVLDLRAETAQWAGEPETNPHLGGLTTGNLAYVIYTSGSTGRPKGVMLEHAQVANVIHGQSEVYQLTPHDRVLQFASYSFDNSVAEIFPALSCGAATVLRPQHIVAPDAAFIDFLDTHRVTITDLPTAFWHQWAQEVAAGRSKPGAALRMVLAGGEKAEIRHLLEWFDGCEDHRSIWVNTYGPTEAAVNATSVPVDKKMAEKMIEIPIGRPVPNATIYILDADRQLAPIGVTGEIFIGGAGVARGYLNLDQLTAERFLRDPFSSDAGARMYRTGDLGCWLADGNIQYQGRNDFQVKIRGFRIELGEIEAKLASYPAVREAVVIAREDTPGDKRLVAYVTAASQTDGTAALIDAEQLRSHLSAVLPEYMIPAAYVRLESLPLTPNGKLDRKALPAPEADAYATRNYEPPQGEIETKLAAIWAEVLKLDKVGRHDNFFALGGHSLLAVRVVTRLQQALGVEVAIRDLFAYPELAGLASFIESAAPSVLPLIVPAKRSERLPLSFAQQRLWFLAQMEGVSEAYHIPVGLRLKGDLNRVALSMALDRILARHEALRTTFAFVDGDPLQRIAAAGASRYQLVEHDLRLHGDAQAELHRLTELEANTPFDLEYGPLIRGRLIRLSEDEHVLLITMHHIVSDGWSMGVLVNELSTLYGAFLRGEDDPLPKLEIQYADYAVWQRQWIEGEILQRQAVYWKTALAGAPEVLELPADHPRPAEQNFAGAFSELRLDEQLTASLKDLSKRHGTTLYITLLAAWSALLARLSGQQDVVIGSPAANRGRAEIENLIGFFVNTLVLRMDLSGSPTVSALLKQAKAQALAAQHHQDIPFEQVVELANPVRSLAHSPLFQVMFAWENLEIGSPELPGLEVRELEAVSYRVAKFDLTLALQEADNTIVGGIEYATSLFEQATIERYLGYFRNLLQAMVADDTQIVDRLPILGEAERHRLLYEWNETYRNYPRGQCIHQLFEEQAAKTPDAVAVVFEDKFLSYAELNRQANQLAHYLIRLGVKPDQRVALCVERSPEMIVGMLAILKAGGAYVPLDPVYPVERLRFMLEDSAPVALLTQSHLAELFIGIDDTRPVLDLTSATPPWKEFAETNLDPDSIGLNPGHLAYIIYTSGSTGQPKGVMVEQANIVRLLTATEAWLQFDDTDVWTLFHSYAFDFSVWEIWGALAYGGRLIVIPKSVARSPQEFYSLVCREKVTVLNQTPSAFRQFITAQAECNEIHSLRHVIFGGEALEVPTLRPWYEQNRDACTRLINMYGITETTVHVTYRLLEEADTLRRGGSPIGCRIPDLRTYILDVYGQPVPVGVAGELYVGGAGVARGYLNRPELTAERFLKDTFVDDPDARIYKTGDLGRWLADGTIEFLGRNDHQIKIRGFRIELGEIETRLAEYAEVREAVVIAREDTPGDKRMVAYYTTSVSEGSEQETLRAEQLRSHLSASLPEYMVPAAYVRLESLPLTPNGKLDRKALPAPEADAYATRNYEPPQGEIETKLAAIWAEVLKLDKVGRHDNFFALGGHSLLAVTLIERIRHSGFCVDVRVLFATPTLADLAATIGADVPVIAVPPNRIFSGCEAITPEMLPLVELTQDEIDRVIDAVSGGVSNVQDIYPLAPVQEGILFHHLLNGEGDPYLVAVQFSFDTRAALERYLSALQAVIDRHDILRTAVMWEGLPEPVQVVLRHAPMHIEEIQLDLEAGDAAEQLYERFNPRRFRIDLRRAPLLRIYFAEDRENGRWLMMQLLHHIVDDNTSLKRMLAEVEAHLLGKSDQLSEPLPFRNLVAQARLGINPEEHESFFRQMLGNVEEPTAPFGLLDVQGNGGDIEEAHLALENELARRLRANARRLGVSAATLCHLAWALVLAKVSGRKNVVFGTVLFGRMQGGEGADQVMGPFINTLPVHISIGEEGTETAVRNTHSVLAGLMRHEHASLALAQRCSAVPAPAPLFSSLLNYRHNTDVTETPSEESLRAWEGIKELRSEERTNYPFSLSVDDLGVGFELTALTPASVGPLHVCLLMHTAIDSLVSALETSPSKAVRALDILSESERHRVLYEWNETKTQWPSNKCVHQLFEEQVEKSPDAVAVVFKDNSLSYAELNNRANQLAHYLIGLGVKPDDRVVILLDRSINLVLAEIAILKCGAAYVPIDRGFPKERQSFLIDDCAAKVVVTLEGIELPENSLVTRVDVDRVALDASLDLPSPDLHSHDVPLSSEAVAYVMYTSGSTGQPKGILVPHRAVSRLVVNNGYAQFEASDRVAFAANPAFDASTLEVWAPLLNGSCMVVIEQDELLDPKRFRRALIHHGVNVLWLTVGLFNRYAEDLEEAIGRLRYLIVGGDALDPRVIARLLRGKRPEHLLNGYGPTETTTFALTHEIQEVPEGASSIPIGRPIANTQVYVLDFQRQPVSIGSTGELYIGGAGVARGYLNRPEMTAERFLKDPFVDDPDARIYKTGDLGRWLADGTIEFLGRNDYQVKIRGFRIELGEIEAKLASYPAVREAVVIAREDTPGDKRLVAYVTAASQTDGTAALIDAEQLRSHLSAVLPEYMIPAAYVRLESLPLTANGKLDRKALPAPEADAYATRNYEPPQGEIETKLAAIWAEVLKLDKVGRHDNFFALGGHSLLAVQIISRIQSAFTIRIPLRRLFELPTVALMAAGIDQLSVKTGDHLIQHHLSAGIIELKKGSGSKPLFLIHPIGGTVFCYSELSKALAPQQSVYALDAVLEDSWAGYRSLESMAESYLQRIRAVQPSGPYQLGGWSLGGLIAWEIAKQIREVGEEVTMLALIDTYPPNSDHAFYVGDLRTRAISLFHEYIAESVGDVDASVIDISDNTEQLAALESLLVQRGLVAYETRSEDTAGLLAIFDQNLYAMEHYSVVPAEQDILLFAATAAEDESSIGDEWNRYTHGRVQYNPIPGNHYTIMKNPGVVRIAARLNEAIQKSAHVNDPAQTYA